MWTSVYKEGEINPPWRRWCFYWVSQILFILSNLTFPLSVGQFILYLWFGSRRRFRQSTSRKPPKNNSTLPQYSCAVSSPTSSTGYGQNDCSCNQQQFTFWMVPLSPSLHIKIFFKWLNFFSLFILFLVAWRWFKLMCTCNMSQIRGQDPFKIRTWWGQANRRPRWTNALSCMCLLPVCGSWHDTKPKSCSPSAKVFKLSSPPVWDKPNEGKKSIFLEVSPLLVYLQ